MISRIVCLLVLVLAPAVGGARRQETPAELSVLAAAAGVGQDVTGWCRGDFRGGHGDAFAIAVGSSGGRYLVLEPDIPPMELARFAGKPSLACYSPAEAGKVADSIRRSATIHGGLTPRWNTTIVCGFVDYTTSVCWQYSPDHRTFVKVGEWIT